MLLKLLLSAQLQAVKPFDELGLEAVLPVLPPAQQNDEGEAIHCCSLKSSVHVALAVSVPMCNLTYSTNLRSFITPDAHCLQASCVVLASRLPHDM